MTGLNAFLVTAGLAAVTVFLLPGLIWAQRVQLGEWQGSLESETEYSRSDSRAPGSSSSRFDSLLQRESLTLRNTVAIYDPRLINFTFGGTFGYSNNWLSSDNQDGPLLGYDLSANILPQKPFSLNLFANRSQDFFSRELAGLTKVLNENLGGTLFADALYIPSSLSFRREFRDDESRIGGNVTRQKDRRNVLTYEGLRGWLNSELELRYEFTDDDNLSVPNLSFRTHEAALNYSLEFGPESNRRWDSRVRYFDQTGFTDFTSLIVSEWLRIKHTDDFQTNYRYTFTDMTSRDGSRFTHDALFSLEHHLYRNLTTQFGIENNYQNLPAGWKEMIRNNLDFTYTKLLPRDGHFDAALGGSFAYETDHFSATQNFVPQETHTAASPFVLPILLNNPFVNPLSVVVTKIAAGPVPIGCFPPSVGPPTLLASGTDYQLQTIGNVVQIQPLPCLGLAPGINPGDTIAVDYSFTAPSSLAFTTATWHANLSLDYGWIRPYFTHYQSDQSPVSGTGGNFLYDLRSDTLGIEFRFDSQRLHSRFLGEGQRNASTRMKYNTIRFNQLLGVAIHPDLTLSLSADQALTAFTNPQRKTLSALGTATLSYRPIPDMTSDLFVVFRLLNDNTNDDERFWQVGLRLRWYYRKIEVAPGFEISQLRRGDARTMDFRPGLRLIRRF
jgi:hypothetical protein